MVRKITAVVAALVVWLAVVLVAGAIIRASWPDYVRVAAAMTFTLPMKLARLLIGAVATLAAGGAAAKIGGRAMAAITGTVLLLVFIPQHVSLWDKFPIWYHLTFLASLIPLSMIGGRFAGTARGDWKPEINRT